FNLGVDFQGGSVITVKFKQKPGTDDIRQALSVAGITEPIIQDSTDKTDEVLIKVPLIETANADESVNQVNAGRESVRNALLGFGAEAKPELSIQEDANAAFKIVGTDSVGPVAGAQLRNQAILATLLGMGGILFFIAFRYDWTYAAG